jgi:(2R)-3-sulfolactate dehydrogenase (NADP+)
VAHFSRLASQITAQVGVRLPGNRRMDLRAKAKTEGLAVASSLLAEIDAL